MGRRKKPVQTEFRIPRDLDAGTAPEVHGALVAALESATDATPVFIELDGDGAVWPLALQLLSSARQTRSQGGLAFGPEATAALETLSPATGEPR